MHVTWATDHISHDAEKGKRRKGKKVSSTRACLNPNLNLPPPPPPSNTAPVFCLQPAGEEGSCSMAGTEADLITPLIATPPPDQPELILTVDDRPGFESFTDHCSSNGTHDDHALPESDNPFEFLGSGGFSVPGSTTLNPFRNHTLEIDGVYEWFKILLCLPVAAIRLVLFGLCLLIGYLATKFALQGWKDKQNPMPAWRRRVMWVTRLCSRCILFSFG